MEPSPVPGGELSRDHSDLVSSQPHEVMNVADEEAEVHLRVAPSHGAPRAGVDGELSAASAPRILQNGRNRRGKCGSDAEEEGALGGEEERQKKGPAWGELKEPMCPKQETEAGGSWHPGSRLVPVTASTSPAHCWAPSSPHLLSPCSDSHVHIQCLNHRDPKSHWGHQITPVDVPGVLGEERGWQTPSCTCMSQVTPWNFLDTFYSSPTLHQVS